MTRHGDWDFGAFPWGFGFAARARARAGRRGWRARSWFESGDMKYVILKLLREKPMHGYEVMKALEERMRGCYSPSPGTVYPTLQWLDDEGLVRAQDVDGKKVYEITDAGRAFLDEHKDVVSDIFERVAEAVEEALGGTMADVNRATGRLMRAVYRRGWRADDAARQKIAEIVERAAQEIEGIGGQA